MSAPIHRPRGAGSGRRGASRARTATLASLLLLLAAAPAAGQHDSSGDAESSHAHELHFSHPVVGESVSPDTEARVAYAREGASTLTELSLSYAPTRGFGIDIGLPAVAASGGDLRIGAPHVGLHLAHFGLAEYGVLLGYGVQLNLFGTRRSGEDDAHAHARVQPFLSLGFKSGPLELIASGQSGGGHALLPEGAADVHATAEPHDHAGSGGGAGRSIGYNLSGLYALSSRVHALLEVYGATAGGSGARDGAGPRLAPGIRIHLRPGVSLSLGASRPLETMDEMPVRTAVTAAYHW